MKHRLILALGLLALACSSSTFQGSSKNATKDQGTTKTVFVPVGGSVNVGGGSCNASDDAIASCHDGVITGNKIGTTTVASGNNTTNVQVYDPLNPPPGATAYIPVGGKAHIPSTAACTSDDKTIATCDTGTVTGVAVGNTSVASTGGGTTSVVVYDPNNPPPGAPGGEPAIDTSSSGGPGGGSDAAPNQLTLTVTVYSGGESLDITNTYTQNSATDTADGYVATYSADPTKAKVTPNGGFPPAQAALFGSFPINAKLTVAGANKQMTLNMLTHGLYSGGTALPSQPVTSSQTSQSLTWTKDEGELKALGNTQIVTSDASAPCNIAPNGNQPAPGVHAVVLTDPAPCDFHLPTVTVSGGVKVADGVGKMSVAIGTYWLTPPPCGETPGCKAAHKFPTGTRPTGAPGLDNGFILIQPDGTSYLLVDAGIAEQPGFPSYQDADTIANEVSQSLGFGATTLKQPSAGTKEKGYSDGTLFKKGSVIAIYDDTTDMGGQIDVDDIIKNANNVLDQGLSLKWNGSIGSP